MPLFTSNLTASLSFSGSFKKKASAIKTAALSFAGAYSLKTGKILSATLSFTGSSVHALQTSFSSILYLSGACFYLPIPVLQKLLITTLTFNGALSLKPSFIIKILTSTLRPIGSLTNAWGTITTFFNVLINTIGQLINGTARQDTQSLNVLTSQQTITNSATLVTDLPPAASVIFIKNLDESDPILVDGSSSFDVFPQTIQPGSGIFISPGNPRPAIYAKSGEATSEIQVISASDPNPQYRYREALDPASLGFSGNIVAIKSHLYSEIMTAALSFTGSLTTSTIPYLFVQFDVNWHDINSTGDVFHIGDSTFDYTNYVAFFKTNATDNHLQLYTNISPFNFVNLPAYTLNTWITIGMRIRITAGEVFAAPLVSGTLYSEVDCGALSGFTEFAFGSFFANTDNVEVDNILIGTAGWGSSDIFSADFTSMTIVPPFDSTAGAGAGNLSASGGTLAKVGGSDGWAQKAFTWP